MVSEGTGHRTAWCEKRPIKQEETQALARQNVSIICGPISCPRLTKGDFLPNSSAPMVPCAPRVSTLPTLPAATREKNQAKE
jgi:hypothetical protein